MATARRSQRQHRTAKQALGAILKSFGLPPAADPNGGDLICP